MGNCFLFNGVSLYMRSKTVRNLEQVYEGVGKGEVKTRTGKRMLLPVVGLMLSVSFLLYN